MSAACHMRGEYMESCNCDYLWPVYLHQSTGACETHEHCYVFMVWRGDEGQCDGVALGGARFAFIIRSERVTADGGWVFAAWPVG